MSRLTPLPMDAHVHERPLTVNKFQRHGRKINNRQNNIMTLVPIVERSQQTGESAELRRHCAMTYLSCASVVECYIIIILLVFSLVRSCACWSGMRIGFIGHCRIETLLIIMRVYYFRVISHIFFDLDELLSMRTNGEIRNDTSLNCYERFVRFVVFISLRKWIQMHFGWLRVQLVQPCLLGIVVYTYVRIRIKKNHPYSVVPHAFKQHIVRIIYVYDYVYVYIMYCMLFNKLRWRISCTVILLCIHHRVCSVRTCHTCGFGVIKIPGLKRPRFLE